MKKQQVLLIGCMITSGSFLYSMENKGMNSSRELSRSRELAHSQEQKKSNESSPATLSRSAEIRAAAHKSQKNQVEQGHSPSAWFDGSHFFPGGGSLPRYNTELNNSSSSKDFWRSSFYGY